MKLRTVIAAGLLIGAAAFAADAGAELFQKAVTQERAAGNLEEAIKLYQRVAKEFASDRALAAKALVAEAKCYEKLGQDKATKLYEQVAHDYRDQAELAATANARLVVLRQREKTTPATLAQRKIEIPEGADGVIAPDQADGQRVVFKDSATGALMMNDLAGKGKRVIFKPNNRTLDYFNVSRDFSLLFMQLTRPDNTEAIAVVGTDGTGFREIAGAWRGISPCVPEISWDNRSVLLCQRQTEGPAQLVRISVADGAIHKIREADSVRYRFSPDGRFIVYSPSYGKAVIIPSQGGEPQPIFERAWPLDWTHDGRYLIIDSDFRGGVDALYLLPVKDGRQAGDPIFIRYGSFIGGYTTPSGDLVYVAPPQGGQYTTWLGKLDAGGRLFGWEKLSLAGSSGNLPTWSPDSTQIAYVAGEHAAGQYQGSLRVRDIATGRERVLYQGIDGSCLWSRQSPNLFCEQNMPSPQNTAEMVFISVETGQAERRGSIPQSINGFPPRLLSRDDKAMYVTSPKNGLTRWEIGAPQSTAVYENSDFSLLAVSPDERWIARREGGKIEIRPMDGGGWRQLTPLGEAAQAAFSPDGDWLIYHDRDAAGKDALFRVSTAGGQPDRLGDFPSANRTGPMWISPDGQKIMAETRNPQDYWILENFEPKEQAAK